MGSSSVSRSALGHVEVSDAGQVLVVAAVPEVGEGPLQGAVPALAVAAHQVGVDALAQVDLLAGELHAGQNHLAVVQVAYVQVDRPPA